MTDLTLLYYTANRIDYGFMHNVRAELWRSAYRVNPDTYYGGGPELVTVTQKPDQWGRNICVGDIGASIYNVYRQLLIGAQAATTPFVACCEDDTLYVPEHFTYRPPADVFFYNRNRWVITRRQADNGRGRTAYFYWRERTQLAMLIAPRDLLIETLEERFAKFPEPIDHETAKATGWGEPGRYEKNLGLAPRRREYFDTVRPCVTFNHTASLMGRRKVLESDVLRDDLPPWGEANDLWNRIHG